MLTVLIVVVLFAGLDALPREVRAQIDGDRAAVASAQTQLRSAQDEVAKQSRAEPDLFRAVSATGHWSDHFVQAAGLLQSAGRDMDELSRLEKRNRRLDRQQAERLLSNERDLRAKALAEASGVQKEAAQWGDWKRQLPQTFLGMERDHQAIHAIDLAPLQQGVHDIVEEVKAQILAISPEVLLAPALASFDALKADLLAFDPLKDIRALLDALQATVTRVLAKLDGNKLLAQSVEMGVLPELYAATDPAATGGQFIGPDGRGESKGYPTVVRPIPPAEDRETALRLWTLSEELTGVRFDLPAAA